MDKNLNLDVWQVSICVLFISFLIYLISISPSIYWNDSGELITAAHSLGMAHSPSFPLYVLFAKLSTFLPIGSIAFKVNLISVIFGCSTILMVFNIALHFLRNKTEYVKSTQQNVSYIWPISSISCMRFYGPALAASFMLSFTHAFWLQSVRAEVYTLNTFLTCLIIYLLLRLKPFKGKSGIIKMGGERLIYLIIFVYGLSLCNHSLLTIYLTPALLFLGVKDRLYLSITPRYLAISLLFLGR